MKTVNKILFTGLAVMMLLAGSGCKKDRWSKYAGYYKINKATVNGNTTLDAGSLRFWFNDNLKDETFNRFYVTINYPTTFMLLSFGGGGFWGVVDNKFRFDFVGSNLDEEYRVIPEIEDLGGNKQRWTLNCYYYIDDTKAYQVGSTEVLEVERMKTF
jgi:hypothetical protein